MSVWTSRGKPLYLSSNPFIALSVISIFSGSQTSSWSQNIEYSAFDFSRRCAKLWHGPSLFFVSFTIKTLSGCAFANPLSISTVSSEEPSSLAMSLQSVKLCARSDASSSARYAPPL